MNRIHYYYNLEANEWYHAAIVVSSDGSVITYLNGDEVDSYSAPSDFDYWDVTNIDCFQVAGGYGHEVFSRSMT